MANYTHTQPNDGDFALLLLASEQQGSVSNDTACLRGIMMREGVFVQQSRYPE
jgi:hypothetical protein